MAEVIELTFAGDWRVTVTSKNAGWSQRVVVSDTDAGTQTLNGVPGASMDVYGNGQAPWKLRIEHNDGSTGWQPSWLQPASSIAGVRYEWSVASEDITTEASDRDFDDLVIRLQKLGMAAQPVPPFAVRPENLQAMPEGIFEASMGRYFMAVRVTNISTVTWPSSARVGLTDRCRAWLAAAGVDVIDNWPAEDQHALGQSVTGGKVHVGALRAWESRLIYFKVDVADAAVRKHQVEIQVHDELAGPEDISLLNKRAKAPMFVSRTTYDSAQGVFVSQCDVGTLTAAIKELTVDLSTFKRAMGNARKIANALTISPGAGDRPGGLGGCNRRVLERIRDQLRAFLDGKDVDLCAIYRDLMCCCARGGPGEAGDDPWTGGRDPGLDFFAWPTVVDYTVDYHPPFTGQYGPFPYEDPWWKVLLIIIAIILSIAAAASSVADLANRSDDVVIGTLTRSILNAQSTQPATSPPATDPGSIDAAVVTLNGSRSLSAAIFTLLDAESGEFFTAAPIVALNGRIDTPGTVLTNAQINTIFQNLSNNPTDPAAQAAVLAYKSGARSGIGRGAMMAGVVPVSPRTDDGVTTYFLNQIRFVQDADTSDGLSCSGDSGSLWLQQGTNAVIALNHAGPSDDSGTSGTGCRIEDVMSQLLIRFA